MEYDIILQTADKILNLITPENLFALSHGEVNKRLGYANGTAESAYVLAALRRMAEDNYLQKNPTTHDNYFQIAGNTFAFKDAGGYEILVENEKLHADSKKYNEVISLKSAQSVIDTNTSIQNLNSNTATFYEKQNNFNKWQRGLTIAILISTASYTFISYLQFKEQQPPTKQEKPQLPISIDSIKSQILSDSVFLKKLKNS